MATRGGSTRISRCQPPRYAETSIQENSHAADEAVLLNHADGISASDNNGCRAKLILQYNIDNNEFRKKVIDSR